MAEEKNQKPVSTPEQPDLEAHSDDNKIENNETTEKITRYKKQAARSFVLALTTLIAIIAVCIAWFVSNTKVSMTGVSISANDNAMFELASVGNAGVFDNEIPEIYKIEGSKWSITENGAEKKGTSTETKTEILWNLNESSNIGNNNTQSGIRPGKQGELQFYVIPKVDNLRIKCHLNICPLDIDENGNNEDNNFKTLKKLLSGHLMFFIEDNNSSTFNWVDCDTGDFNLSFKNKTPVLITLKWTWPNLWENIDASIRTEVKENEKYNEYFFYGSTSADNDTTNTSNENVDDDTLNHLYNNADMFIGENVTWLLVQLSAEPA